MIPNKQCMKEILKYICEHNKVKVRTDACYNISLSSLNVSTLLEQMSKETTYSLEELAYNFMQCYYNGLIYVNFNYQQKDILSATSDINGITLRGMEFMN